MVYVMSDIHGEKDRYDTMLDRIQFTNNDTLYILGDVIDRGPYGIDILRDMMQRPNIHLILGNHEALMLETFWGKDDYGARQIWTGNSGWITYQDMLYFTPTPERMKILQYIKNAPDHLDIEVNGQKFHLVHGYPSHDRITRLWDRPDPIPTEPPVPGAITIIGHTPTYDLNIQVEGYNENGPYEIFYGPGLIAIDCGCGHKTELRRLACLRLDDMQEFYV